MGGPFKPQLIGDKENGRQQREGKKAKDSKNPEKSSATDVKQQETGKDGSFGVAGEDDHGLLGGLLEDSYYRDGDGVRRSVLICNGWPWSRRRRVGEVWLH